MVKDSNVPKSGRLDEYFASLIGELSENGYSEETIFESFDQALYDYFAPDNSDLDFYDYDELDDEDDLEGEY